VVKLGMKDLKTKYGYLIVVEECHIFHLIKLDKTYNVQTEYGDIIVFNKTMEESRKIIEKYVLDNEIVNYREEEMMLKVGDSVRIISDRSEYEPFKKYIGTVHKIDSIIDNEYYLEGIFDSYSPYIPRIYYYDDELELVKDKSTLDNNTIALIEAIGMQTENKIRELNGEALAYNEQSFIDLIKKYEKE